MKALLERASAHVPVGLDQRRPRADSALYDEQAHGILKNDLGGGST